MKFSTFEDPIHIFFNKYTSLHQTYALGWIIEKLHYKNIHSIP